MGVFTNEGGTMKKGLITLTLIASCACFASAEQWKTLGTRPMGMGGAFVAMAQGPMAQYWNPGGLAMKSSASISGLEIPITMGLEATGDILKNTSEIGEMVNQLSAVKSAQRGHSAITPAQAADFVKTMSLLGSMTGEGKGAMIETAGGANFKFAKVAISINNYTSIGLNPYIDVRNLGLGTTGTSIQFAGNSGASAPSGYATAVSNLTTALNRLDGTNTNAVYKLLCGTGGNCDSSITNNATLANALAAYASSLNITPTQVSEAAQNISNYAATAGPVVNGAISGGSYTGNESNLTVDAASFTEIAFGYGKFVKFLDGLSIGANLKMINGQMGHTGFRFMENSKTGDAFQMDNLKTSWAPAIDLGFLWDINEKYPKLPFHPKMGLVIRNLNSPKFDRPDQVGGTYKLDRQARLGFAIHPAKFWSFALDMDMTKNKTAVRGFESRQLALGTEINLVNAKAFNIPLRAGLMKNMAEKSSKMAYTMGTGINLLYLHFDVAAAISSDTTIMDGEKIPTKGTISASLGLLF